LLFEALFVPQPIREAVDGRAWVRAMLDAEAALARAEARAGVIPSEAAELIVRACEAGFDPEQIGEEGRRVANPAEPLVRRLREVSEWAHHGATSQDIVDTAMMLVASRARVLILEQADGVAAACAKLARQHRTTEMAARTLLQQAVPTTFGLKAAGWLAGVVQAGRRLAAVELAGALGLVAGACGKIALDVTLLAQTEVGEVSAPAGGSTAMPHKRNPASAIVAVAAARQVNPQIDLLVEHERGAGTWQAEWATVASALGFAGGAAAATRETLEGLRVNDDRMRANIHPIVGSQPDAVDANAFIDRALEAYGHA